MTIGTSTVFPGQPRGSLADDEGTGNSSWNRTFSDLAASGVTMSGVAQAFGPPSPSAQNLLGQRTDLSGLLTSTTTTSSYTSQSQGSGYAAGGTASLAPNSKHGLMKSYEMHCDGILERVLHRQSEQTDRMLESLVEKQMQNDWNVEREWWKRELVGNRNFVDSHGRAGSGGGGSLPALENGSVSGQQRSQPTGLLLNDAVSHGAASIRDCDLTVVKKHLEIIREMKDSNDVFQMVEKFEKIAASQGSRSGYRASWLLLREVISCNPQNPFNRALATLTHLCRQYQNYIRNRVKTASLKGQDISTQIYFSNEFAGNVAAFVKLTTGSNASVWDALYYCLRCGDARAALEVLSSTQAANAEFPEEMTVIHRILEEFGRRQGNSLCVFQAGAPMTSEKSAVLNLYEKTKSMESQNTNKISVLALLCGQHLEAVPTIEDHLFGRLWVAVQDREKCEAIIKEEADTIQKWGPSYFATDDAGPWGYCLPLLSTQQFGTALIFLFEAGGATGALEASHLGLALSNANVEVRNLGDDRPSRDLGADLLTKYAQMLEKDPSIGQEAALQYLLRVRPESVAHEQIAELVVRSGERFHFLAGNFDPSFGRQGSELDKFLPAKVVDSILESAADLTRRQAADSSKAVVCAELYMLAKAYPKLIDFLIQAVSPPDAFNDEIRDWSEKGRSFSNNWLVNRSTVTESLDSNNKSELAETLKKLLQLRDFFGLYREGKYEEALSVLAATELLPMSPEQVDPKSRSFKGLHPALKDAFPSILNAGVECLSRNYHRLKSESRTMTSELEAHLGQLATHARLFALFSGLANMPGDCRSNISSMRSQMV